MTWPEQKQVIIAIGKVPEHNRGGQPSARPLQVRFGPAAPPPCGFCSLCRGDSRDARRIALRPAAIGNLTGDLSMPGRKEQGGGDRCRQRLDDERGGNRHNPCRAAHQQRWTHMSAIWPCIKRQLLAIGHQPLRCLREPSPAIIQQLGKRLREHAAWPPPRQVPPRRSDLRLIPRRRWR